MSKKFPSNPSHPERICWGCDKFCAISDMACSNERSPHPAELFGEDWQSWGEKPFGASTSMNTTDVPLPIATAVDAA